MLKKRNTYDLSQVESTLQLKTWWAAAVILPLARRCTLFICNYTYIRPDQLTVAAFLLRVLVGMSFLKGGIFIVIGSVLFQVAYLIDCMDGACARLLGLDSKFGRYFDHFSDIAGGVLSLTCLAYYAGVLFTPQVITIIFLYIFEYFITYVFNIIIARNSGDEKSYLENENNFGFIRSAALNPGVYAGDTCKPPQYGSASLTKGEPLPRNPGLAGSFSFPVPRRSRGEPGELKGFIGCFNKYRNFFFKRHFKSFISLPDFEALIITIFPILGYPAIGLSNGFYLIIIVVGYKLFSGIITIRNKGHLFP